MAEITVEPSGDGTFEVTVTDADTSTTHTVTASEETLNDVGGGASPEEVVEASFRFMLDREPKEAIVRRFDLTIIERYFPEYRRALAEYLP